MPAEFAAIDFANNAYPISSKPRTIKLEDGHAEFYEDKFLGNAWFDLEDVNYLDLNGDGHYEAVVQILWVACGGSCDGGSQLFYFFGVQRGNLTLLNRMETGSLAYDCGLRSFILSKSNLVLETFQVCAFNGISFTEIRNSRDQGMSYGKFGADKFTRFALQFKNGRFQVTHREVFPNALTDIKNYDPEIRINND